MAADGSALYVNVNRRTSSTRAGYMPPQAQRSCRVYCLQLASSSLTLLYKSRSCTGLALSPSQRHLASIAKHTLTLYDVRSQQRHKFAHTNPLTCLAFHPRDPYIATGDATGKILLWYNCFTSSPSSSPSPPAHSFTPVPVTSTLHWHAHSVSCLSFTHDGVYLLSGGEESVMVIWQLETGHKQFIPRLLSPLRSICVSLDNLFYALAHADNAVRLVSAVSSRVARSIQGLEYAGQGRSRADDGGRPLLVEGGGRRPHQRTWRVRASVGPLGGCTRGRR